MTRRLEGPLAAQGTEDSRAERRGGPQPRLLRPCCPALEALRRGTFGMPRVLPELRFPGLLPALVGTWHHGVCSLHPQALSLVAGHEPSHWSGPSIWEALSSHF